MKMVIQGSTTGSRRKPAVFWAKIPTIAGSGSKDIFMYYGNVNAESESDGNAVFLFFDDFNDNSIDTSKWVTAHSSRTTESDGKLKVGLNTYGDGFALTAQSFARDNISAEYEYKFANGNDPMKRNIAFMGWHDSSTNFSTERWVYAYGCYKNYYNPTNTCDVIQKGQYKKALGTIFPHNVWSKNVRLRLRNTYGNYYERSVDGGSTWINDYTTSSYSDTNLRWGIMATEGLHEIDNFRIRNYANVEPGVSLGPEETKVVPKPPFADTDPYTTITLAPARPDAYDGWYVTLPTITLTSNKPGATYYQWDSKVGSWTTYGGTINFPPAFDKAIDASGSHTLYFHSESGSLQEEVRFFKFKVDSGYRMPAAVGGTCEDCHGSGSGLVGGDHVTWFNGTPHDLGLNDDGTDGYPAVLPAGSSTKCQRCHYDSMVQGPDGKPISPRFLRITNANPDDPDGIRDPAGVVHEVLGNDNTLCFACHTDKTGAYTGQQVFEQTMHSQNGSFASTTAISRWPDVSYGQGMCGNCHNPHGVAGTNDYRRKPKNDLCAECHDETAPLTAKVSKAGTYYELKDSTTDSLFSQTNPGYGWYAFSDIEKTMDYGDISSEAILGAEDSFEYGKVVLKISQDIYLPGSGSVGIKVYVNNAPTSTGGTLVGDWTKPLMVAIGGNNSITLDIKDWLNANQEQNVYIILVIPATSYAANNQSITGNFVGQYDDYNPAGGKDYYAYQGKSKFASSAHGSGTNPLTIWPNTAETGGSIGSGGATAGECINCHNPHGKGDVNDVALPLMLYDKEEDLCFACHDKTSTSDKGKNIKERFTASTSNWAKHGITKAEQDISYTKLECNSCHNSHLNTAKRKVIDPNNKTVLYNLKKDGMVGFCLECHDKAYPIKEGVRTVASGTYLWGIVSSAPSQADINSVMAVDYANNYHGDLAATETFDNHTIPGTTEFVNRDIDYGPLKAPYSRGYPALDCTVCHDEHGSGQVFAFKENINGQAVNVGNGQDLLPLCSACHEVTSIRNAHEVNCYSSICHGGNPSTNDYRNLPTSAPTPCAMCHNHARTKVWMPVSNSPGSF